MLNSPFISALARSILSGEAAVEPIVARASRTLGKNWRWLRPLARRYLKAFGSEARPKQRDVCAFLAGDEGLMRAHRRHGKKMRIESWLAEPMPMRPVDAAKAWEIPAIESVGALAAWLGISPSELEWFADLKRLGAKLGPDRIDDDPISHYHYRILTKVGGNIRLIEAPKRKLKELQRKILSEILDKIPVHFAVHGFLKGHSIKTFAAGHVGRRVVLRMDLKDFFPSLSGARVQAFFRTAGYPESVSKFLGGICTNSVPRSLWSAVRSEIDSPTFADVRALYFSPHLPQGAPTSPALANLLSYRVDCRLSGLAKSAGAVFTRYADDLALSGDDAFERCVESFAIQAAAILLEEGFTVQHRKTRIMRQGVRQSLAGMVINERMNIVRGEFDRLKAILTNCARHGPESQNREGHAYFRLHLEGRVGFVGMVNSAKGKRMRKIFEQIRW